MKRALVLGTAALAFILSSTVVAQTKPDLSGTWTLDEAKSDPAPARRGGGGGGRGGRMGGVPATSLTIKQTPAELTVERTTEMGSQTIIYKLDGTESKNTIGMGPATSKASWDGANLAVATTQTMQGRGGGEVTIESKEVYSRTGDVLTLEVTRNTQAGTQTRKLVYTKKG
jgi:hypothetical protein